LRKPESLGEDIP